MLSWALAIVSVARSIFISVLGDDLFNRDKVALALRRFIQKSLAIFGSGIDDDIVAHDISDCPDAARFIEINFHLFELVHIAENGIELFYERLLVGVGELDAREGGQVFEFLYGYHRLNTSLLSEH